MIYICDDEKPNKNNDNEKVRTKKFKHKQKYSSDKYSEKSHDSNDRRIVLVKEIKQKVLYSSECDDHNFKSKRAVKDKDINKEKMEYPL